MKNNKTIRLIVGFAIACAIILLIVNSAGCVAYKNVRVEIIDKEPPTTLVADVDGEIEKIQVPRWYYELHPIGWINYYQIRKSKDYTKP